MSQAPRRSILRGIVLLARFRPEAFAEFEATPQGFLNSLAPPLALVLVVFFFLWHRFGVLPALQILLVLVVALLAPIVAGEFVARRMGRGAQWLRYAVAFNWCHWAFLGAGLVAATAAVALILSGIPQATVSSLVNVLALGYGLALYLFVARHGLGLGWGAALAFIVAMHLGGGLFLMAPEFVSNLFAPASPP